MRGRRGNVLRFLGVALATTMLVVPAGAGDATEDNTVESTEDSTWYVDTYGHPVEPYAQIPKELHAGAPFTWVSLEGKEPTRCGGYAVIYDPSTVVDGLATIISEGKYVNPTRSFAINPPTSYPTKDEKTTFPNGPGTSAECTSPSSGTAKASWGRYLSDAFSIESASSDTTNVKVPDDDLVVGETTNKLQGIKVGPLSIGSVFSWLKVEFRPSAEPKISYRLEISGVTDGKSFSGASEDGLVLSGNAVGGGELAEQFNEQARTQDQTMLEALGHGGLRLVEPRIGVSTANRYVIELSALDAMMRFTPRDGQIGQAFGLRLGVSRAAGRYIYFGAGAPHDGYPYIEDPDWGLN